MSAFVSSQTPNPKSQRLEDFCIAGFQLKTHQITKAMRSCPKSPSYPNKTRCLTTGSKHVIYSRNLNFEQHTYSKFMQEFDTQTVIGEGEHSIVYKARNTSDFQYYAIKQLKKRLRGKKDREQSLREISMLSQISSCSSGHESSILKYYDSWEEHSYFYIRTELCTSSLKDYISSQVLEEKEIWKICRDVTFGLWLIHSHGYIHLDIKPSNLFLKDGSVKIGDFGHMIAAGSDVVNEGDAAYTANEVLDNRACYESDIFSLGLILFEMATGVVMPSSGEKWHTLREGQVPIESLKVSVTLRDLIVRMLQPVPFMRPSAASIIHTHFQDQALVTPEPIDFKSKIATAPPEFEVHEITQQYKSDLAVNLFDIFKSM